MPDRIEPTEELAEKLYKAAGEELIFRITHERNGDDGGDYLNSAAEVFEAMRWITWDQCDHRALDLMLNTPPDHNAQDDIHVIGEIHVPRLGNLASEGIPDAFHELNCIALQEVED